MAEVHKLPWVNNLDVANQTDYAAYLRGLAELIDTGTVQPQGLALVLHLPGDTITVARVGMTALEAAGALALSLRTI